LFCWRNRNRCNLCEQVQVSGPIPRLTNVATNLAEGNLDIEVPGRDQRNEIGSLARALDGSARRCVEKIELERQSLRLASRSKLNGNAARPRKPPATRKFEAAVASWAPP
jgi:methyl-accepting chemotaxis protein